MHRLIPPVVSLVLVILLSVHGRSEQFNPASVPATLANYETRFQDLEAQLAVFLQGEEHCSGCDCNACCPGWFGSIDYLLWKIERNDLAFAIQNPAGNGVPSGGQGVRSLDLDWNSGFRAAIGRRTSSGWEIGFAYTRIESNDRQAFSPGANQVLAVLSTPATGLTNANSVAAQTSFRYNVFDIELGHWFDINDSLSLEAIAGIRYGSIDHRIQAIYNGGAFVNGLIDVPTNLDTYGGRVGGLVHWNFSPSLSLFGKTAATVSAGNVNARRREVNAGVATIDASRQTDQIMPVLEVALGARYYLNNLSFGVAYEWTSWFNAVSPLEFTDNFNGGVINSSTRDLGLHGLTVNTVLAY